MTTRRYEIRLYPDATWNEETENWDLGEPTETVRQLDAENPSAARNAAETTVDETRSETTRRRIRGEWQDLTVYLPACDALMAWRTARGVMALVIG